MSSSVRHPAGKVHLDGEACDGLSRLVDARLDELRDLQYERQSGTLTSS